MKLCCAVNGNHLCLRCGNTLCSECWLLYELHTSLQGRKTCVKRLEHSYMSHETIDDPEHKESVEGLRRLSMEDLK